MRKWLKRAVDIVISLIVLVILSPLFIVLFILVKLKLGSPVLFAQERPGLHGDVFNMFKFRSMTDACDPNGNLLPDEMRLTNFGRRLRKSSLDELPEIFNILKGEMSLVGPRPLLVRYLVRYSVFQARRHEVKPGLTGWAQVNGRNAISWEEKFKLDVWYVDNWSLWLDFKILLMTVKKVINSDGISSGTSGTMEEFEGEQVGGSK